MAMDMLEIISGQPYFCATWWERKNEGERVSSAIFADCVS